MTNLLQIGASWLADQIHLGVGGVVLELQRPEGVVAPHPERRAQMPRGLSLPELEVAASLALGGLELLDGDRAGDLRGCERDGDTRAAVLDWLRSTGDADTAEDIESIEPDADGLTDLGAGLCVLAAD